MNLESIAAGTETELSLTLLGHMMPLQAWPSPTLAALKIRISQRKTQSGPGAPIAR